QIVNGLLKNVSRIEALYDALDCTQNGFNPLERIKGAISLVAHIELRKKGIVKPNTWKPADNLYYMAESAKRRCAFSSEFAGLFLAMNGFDAAGTLNYLLSRKPMEALEEIGRMMSLDREREAVRELYSLVRK
ncbi:MAG: hypothetical protein KGH50_04230, partial [Candidatus Micrarchaeota archaeon]|nr:hypothetical protein [Candidatus Micrarchaeota archaeon]